MDIIKEAKAEAMRKREARNVDGSIRLSLDRAIANIIWKWKVCAVFIGAGTSGSEHRGRAVASLFTEWTPTNISTS